MISSNREFDITRHFLILVLVLSLTLLGPTEVLALLVEDVIPNQMEELKLNQLLIGLLLAFIATLAAYWVWRGLRMNGKDKLDNKNIEHFG